MSTFAYDDPTFVSSSNSGIEIETNTSEVPQNFTNGQLSSSLSASFQIDWSPSNLLSSSDTDTENRSPRHEDRPPEGTEDPNIINNKFPSLQPREDYQLIVPASYRKGVLNWKPCLLAANLSFVMLLEVGSRVPDGPIDEVIYCFPLRNITNIETVMSSRKGDTFALSVLDKSWRRRPRTERIRLRVSGREDVPSIIDRLLSLQHTPTAQTTSDLVVVPYSDAHLLVAEMKRRYRTIALESFASTTIRNAEAAINRIYRNALNHISQIPDRRFSGQICSQTQIRLLQRRAARQAGGALGLASALRSIRLARLAFGLSTLRNNCLRSVCRDTETVMKQNLSLGIDWVARAQSFSARYGRRHALVQLTTVLQRSSLWFAFNRLHKATTGFVPRQKRIHTILRSLFKSEELTISRLSPLLHRWKVIADLMGQRDRRLHCFVIRKMNDQHQTVLRRWFDVVLMQSFRDSVATERLVASCGAAQLRLKFLALLAMTEAMGRRRVMTRLKLIQCLNRDLELMKTEKNISLRSGFLRIVCHVISGKLRSSLRSSFDILRLNVAASVLVHSRRRLAAISLACVANHNKVRTITDTIRTMSHYAISITTRERLAAVSFRQILANPFYLVLRLGFSAFTGEISVNAHEFRLLNTCQKLVNALHIPLVLRPVSTGFKAFLRVMREPEPLSRLCARIVLPSTLSDSDISPEFPSAEFRHLLVRAPPGSNSSDLSSTLHYPNFHNRLEAIRTSLNSASPRNFVITDRLFSPSESVRATCATPSSTVIDIPSDIKVDMRLADLTKARIAVQGSLEPLGVGRVVARLNRMVSDLETTYHLTK